MKWGVIRNHNNAKEVSCTGLDKAPAVSIWTDAAQRQDPGFCFVYGALFCTVLLDFFEFLL